MIQYPTFTYRQYAFYLTTSGVFIGLIDGEHDVDGFYLTTSGVCSGLIDGEHGVDGFI